MRGIYVSLLFVMMAGAQTSLKERADAFFAERTRLLKQAKTAFDTEMTREKAGDCQKAATTLAINECLSREIPISTANYKTYAGALRSMLVQPNPYTEGTENLSGPTGKPLTPEEQARNFDQFEAAWAKYREAMCAGAYGLYKSGTAAGYMGGYCELMMVRSHMRELEGVYGGYFSH